MRALRVANYSSVLELLTELYMKRIVLYGFDKDDSRCLCDMVNELAGKEVDETLSVECYDSRKNFVKALDSGICPDIIFYYIDLTKHTKTAEEIDTIRNIKERLSLCKIVFVSERNKYSSEIYNVDHVCLIQKPFLPSTVERAIKLCMEQIDSEDRAMFSFKSVHTIYRIRQRDILYFEKELRIIHIIDIYGKVYDIYAKYDEITDQLDGRFLRCHNGVIVNMDYVNRLDNRSVIVRFKGKEADLPVSRRYKDEAIKTFAKYVKV